MVASETGTLDVRRLCGRLTARKNLILREFREHRSYPLCDGNVPRSMRGLRDNEASGLGSTARQHLDEWYTRK